MSTVTVGAAQVHYDVKGSGPRLMLVHGTGSGGAEFVWGQLAGRFAEHHTVILPDLSGTERTVDDGAALTVEGLAGQVIAVIEDTGGEPVDLVGFSLGGTIAAAIAGLRPDLVHRLVSVAGFPDSKDPALRHTMTLWRDLSDRPESFGRFATISAFSSRALTDLGNDAVDANLTVMRPDPGTLRHIDLNLRLDIGALLPAITAPTLVIGCALDGTVPVGATFRLHEAIADSRYVEFDTGHVVLAEQPERFMQVVGDFLAKP